MEITEVGVRIVERSEDRLKAVCTMTIDDCFVVRDIKVVEGQTGLFVAMPSRKKTMRCPQCGHKNEIRSRFCAECGTRQAPRNNHNERSASHTDIAHPINTECREMIQQVILEAYREELAEYLAEQQAEAGAQAGFDREPERNEPDDRMSDPTLSAPSEADVVAEKPRHPRREPERTNENRQHERLPEPRPDRADARPERLEPRRPQPVTQHTEDGFAAGIF